MMRDYQGHTTAFGLALAGCGLAGYGLGLSTPGWLFLALPLAVVVGMPHGALDLPSARILGARHSASAQARYVAAYLGLVAVTLLFWLWQPGVALALFLGYSMLHFSEDWAADDTLARWAGGLSIVGAPALCHSARVEMLFGLIATPAGADPVTALAVAAGALGLALGVARALWCRDRAAAEIGLLWLGAWCLPPLAFFAIYYGALHAYRQTGLALARLGAHRRAALREAIGLSVLPIVLGALVVAGAWWLPGLRPDQAVLRVVFIGLAALTVPHMALAARTGPARAG